MFSIAFANADPKTTEVAPPLATVTQGIEADYPFIGSAQQV